MTWKFEVVATKDRRLLSRILQALENQGVIIHTFVGEADEEAVHVSFVISSDHDKAYRIQALLHHLENICSVSFVVTESSVTSPAMASEPEIPYGDPG